MTCVRVMEALNRAKISRQIVEPASPQVGKIMVRPVRVTRRPVTMEPTPMPMLMGTSSSPIWEADMPWVTRR